MNSDHFLNERVSYCYYETSLILFVKEKVPQIQYILYFLTFLNNEFRPLFIMTVYS